MTSAKSRKASNGFPNKSSRPRHDLANRYSSVSDPPDVLIASQTSIRTSTCNKWNQPLIIVVHPVNKGVDIGRWRTISKRRKTAPMWILHQWIRLVNLLQIYATHNIFATCNLNDFDLLWKFALIFSIQDTHHRVFRMIDFRHLNMDYSVWMPRRLYWKFWSISIKEDIYHMEFGSISNIHVVHRTSNIFWMP